MARANHAFAQPARDEQLRNPLPALDGAGWYRDGVSGKRVLCLGAGGGRQSALFAAAGAVVTVVDLSPEMLAIDRQVAAERGYVVRTIEASMDDLSALPADGFDVVHQPVSTCYVPDVTAVYQQVARVLSCGGLYVSQHKQPASLQASDSVSPLGYCLAEPYYRRAPLRQASASWHREQGTLEYLHRWEDLIGGLCRCGFVVEDLREPFHADPHGDPGSFSHRAMYAPPYVRIKARRVAPR